MMDVSVQYSLDQTFFFWLIIFIWTPICAPSTMIPCTNHPISDIAGIEYPETLKGRALPPLIGTSWVRMLAGETDSPRTAKDYLAWELFGNRAVRQGDWKLRWQWKPYGKGDWELFNLAADPGERTDLASTEPEKVAALQTLWTDYVKTNNVILPSRAIFEGLDDMLPQRFPDDAGYPPLLYKQQFIPPDDMQANPKP